MIIDCIKVNSKIEANKTCCICYESSDNIIQCSQCVDGIVCKDCRSLLSDCQKVLCPICRQSSDSFIIEIKKEIQPDIIQNVYIPEKNYICSRSCFCQTYECILFTLMYLFISLIIGMIVINSIFGIAIGSKSMMFVEYIIYLMTGFCFNTIICFCCSRLFFQVNN